MPTIRSEDIYFADHYNDVYNTYFLKLLAQRDSLEKLSEYTGVYETERYITCQIWN